MTGCSVPDAVAAPGFVGASTKAYMGQAQTLAWLDGIATAIDERPELTAGGVRMFVIPAFPLIPAALERLGSRGVIVGAQTVSWGDGALTGEVSAALLREMGVGIVEIGHAERREHFGESDEVIAQKVRVSLDAGITPLLCIGEPERVPTAEAAEFCRRQVLSALGGSLVELPALVLAYEPIWAIGASEPAAADYVSGVVTAVRDTLRAERAQSIPDAVEHHVPVIYGGSAGPGLLQTLHGVDGLFLGRFAHDPANFVKVVDEAIALRA